MLTLVDRKKVRQRIRYRVRAKLHGSVARPRLTVFRSAKHIYAQAIDDDSGRTVAQASSLDKEIRSALGSGSNIKAAAQVGALVAQRLKEAGVESVVFDRGGFLYHGRIKALAEAVREGGLRF
jgi:large subunit ribosomal protein L18